MNGNDGKESNNSDRELQAYLDGSDGLSALYRTSASGEPPASLDAAILAASRGNAGEPEGTGRQRGGSRARAMFPLAASLLLGVMLGLAGREMLLTRTDRQADDPVVIAVAPPAAELRELDAAGASKALEDASDAVTATDSGGERRVAAAGQPAPPPSPIREAVAESFLDSGPAADSAVPRENIAMSRASSRLEITEATGGAGAGLADTEARRPPPSVRSSEAARGQQVAGLEDLVVTGSRIARREQEQPDYRASQQRWLEKLLELERQQADERQTLEQLTLQLEREKALFRQAWPELPLDERLRELDAEGTPAP